MEEESKRVQEQRRFDEDDEALNPSEEAIRTGKEKEGKKKENQRKEEKKEGA